MTLADDNKQFRADPAIRQFHVTLHLPVRIRARSPGQAARRALKLLRGSLGLHLRVLDTTAGTLPVNLYVDQEED